MVTIITDDMDCTAIADVVGEASRVRYYPTMPEVRALEWLGNRYAVSEYLLASLTRDTKCPYRPMLEFDPMEVADALAADGVDRVPCLDEGTRLALIVWCIGPSEPPYEDVE